jgi:hypothetical protein
MDQGRPRMGVIEFRCRNGSSQSVTGGTDMSVLTIVVILAVVATAAVLVTGIGSMAHGGSFDDRHSHQLMFARVGVQGAALFLIVVALLLSQQ